MKAGIRHIFELYGILRVYYFNGYVPYTIRWMKYTLEVLSPFGFNHWVMRNSNALHTCFNERNTFVLKFITNESYIRFGIKYSQGDVSTLSLVLLPFAACQTLSSTLHRAKSTTEAHSRWMKTPLCRVQASHRPCDYR